MSANHSITNLLSPNYHAKFHGDTISRSQEHDDENRFFW